MCFTTHATHQLESQGQASAAGLTHHKSDSPTGKPRTANICRVQMQLTTEDTHQLESQRQPLSAGPECSPSQKPLTIWRAKDGHVSRIQIHCSPQKPLTLWRAKGRCCQEGQNAAHCRSHSQAGEPRTGVVSRAQIQLTMKVTHKLEDQGQA